MVLIVFLNQNTFKFFVILHFYPSMSSSLHDLPLQCMISCHHYDACKLVTYVRTEDVKNHQETLSKCSEDWGGAIDAQRAYSHFEHTQVQTDVCKTYLVEIASFLKIHFWMVSAFLLAYRLKSDFAKKVSSNARSTCPFKYRE